MTKVLVVATSRKTRGGITSVVKAHETGEQWKKYHCRWIETHRDGPAWRKVWYFVTAFVEFLFLLPYYDIVHIHVGLKASVRRKMFFANVTKAFRKKLIVHFHPATERHLFDDKYKDDIQKLFAKSDKLIVLSPQWIRLVNDAFPDNHFDIQYLYNPCPVVKRDRSNKRKHILFAGTLSERKGYNRLMEGFVRIAPKHPDWKLVYAGNGAISQAKVLQKKLNLPDSQVEFLGWVKGKMKDKTFNEASIYCLPSWGEGFPMGVLDAIAYGVPVITTPVGGIMDVIRDGENGLIFEVQDLNQLAIDMELLITSEALREKLVEGGDRLRNSEFDIKRICEQLDAIYTELGKN